MKIQKTNKFISISNGLIEKLSHYLLIGLSLDMWRDSKQSIIDAH